MPIIELSRIVAFAARPGDAGIGPGAASAPRTRRAGAFRAGAGAMTHGLDAETLRTASDQHSQQCGDGEGV